MTNLGCSKCGESTIRLMLLAMISDAGATVSPDPTKCNDGEEHDFTEKETTDVANR